MFHTTDATTARQDAATVMPDDFSCLLSLFTDIIVSLESTVAEKFRFSLSRDNHFDKIVCFLVLPVL